MSGEHQKRRDQLNQETGTDFDKKYADLMEENHVKVLAFMEHEARSGTDPDLKAYAIKMVPVINAHLNAIRKIKGQLK
jgi:putative membrane protein